MNKRLHHLLRDRKGAGAVEFALVLPVLVLLIVGIMQMGALFAAHTALRNAVAEGARFATIYPRPSDAAIIAKVDANRSLTTSNYTTPVVTWGRQGPRHYVVVRSTYLVSLNFIFFKTPIRLAYSRRAYVPPPVMVVT